MSKRKGNKGNKGNDYEVGYGKPPVQRRFKQGVSGNPRGRRPDSKNILTLLEAELSKEISISENGQRRTITKREAMLKQLTNRAIAGDNRAIKLILDQFSTSEDTDSCDDEQSGRVPIRYVQGLLRQADAERARQADVVKARQILANGADSRTLDGIPRSAPV